ncbi:RNA pseudouridine synthase [Desulfovibrio sp. OttesenSCG-928-G11]|nr:RNA pseudouridine synthase [Desulfovibrio sp. OttesenSCG-928-G11]
MPAQPDLDFTLPADAPAMRLDAALAPLLPGLGLRARRRLWTWSKILVNGQERRPGFMVRGGDRIQLQGAMATEPAPLLGIRLVELEAGLAALYKPAGLHSAHIMACPEPSLESLLPALWPELLRHWRALRQQPGAPGGIFQNEAETTSPDNTPALLTRLDRATSGLVLTALDAQAGARFRRHEKQGLARKSYLALLAGHLERDLRLDFRLDTDGGAISRVLDCREADPARHTLAEPLARAALTENGPTPDADGPFTLARVRIFRGARHQIRAHLAAAGFPLLGEWLYAPAAQEARPLYLHHAALEAPDFAARCLPVWLENWPGSEAISL